MPFHQPITIERLSTSNGIRISGVFDVTVNAMWREQPTHETLEAEVFAGFEAAGVAGLVVRLEERCGLIFVRDRGRFPGDEIEAHSVTR